MGDRGAAGTAITLRRTQNLMGREFIRNYARCFLQIPERHQGGTYCRAALAGQWSTLQRKREEH